MSERDQKVRLLSAVSPVSKKKPRPHRKVEKIKTTAAGLPSFRNGKELLSHLIMLQQRREVLRHLVRELDLYVEHDIDEPKVMRCSSECVSGHVPSGVVFGVQRELEAQIRGVSEDIEALNRSTVNLTST